MKVTCQLIAGDDMFLKCLEYLDRLRLGVSPEDTSEVCGQVKTPTTCLEMSIKNISTG